MVQTPTALQPQHHPKYKCSRSLQIELSSPHISRVHLPCGLQARKRRLPCSVFNSPSTRNRHASACPCRRPPLKNALHNGKCSNVPCTMGSFVPQIHSLLVSSSGSGPSVGAPSAALFGRGAVGLTSHCAPENVDSKSPCGDGSTKPNPSAKTREWLYRTCAPSMERTRLRPRSTRCALGQRGGPSKPPDDPPNRRYGSFCCPIGN